LKSTRPSFYPLSQSNQIFTHFPPFGNTISKSYI